MYDNVVFRDWNGVELKKVTVPHGSKVDPPPNPQTFVLNGYVFTFIGWLGDIGGVFDGTARGYETFKAQYFAQVADAKTLATLGNAQKQAVATGNGAGAGSGKGGTTSKTTASTGSSKTTSSSTSKTSTTSKTTTKDTADDDIGTPKSDVVSAEDMHSRVAMDEARKRFIPYQYYRDQVKGTPKDPGIVAKLEPAPKSNNADIQPEYPGDASAVGQVKENTKVLSANDYTAEQLKNLDDNTLYEENATDEEIAVAMSEASKRAEEDDKTLNGEKKSDIPWPLVGIAGGVLAIIIIAFLIWNKKHKYSEEE